MKFGIVALTTLITTIGLAVPVNAQIRRPSQDFFDQGRERLEREIQGLQGEPSNSEQSLKKPQAEPLLEVSPLPGSDRIQPPNQVEIPKPVPSEDETPSQKPDEVNNSGS
jgi:hypothetical protein